MKRSTQRGPVEPSHSALEGNGAHRPPRRRRSRSRLLIGVGSSAGGLEALATMFRRLPAGLPCSMVVAQHLSSTRPSMLPELLARETAMQVVAASDGARIAPGVIYVAPANAHVRVIAPGTLQLTQPQPADVPKPSVDALFESIAACVGSRCVAVVLSGTGRDGAQGVRAVRDAGGVVLAQDDSARYNGMPQEAIASGCVDTVAGASRIGDIVVALARGEQPAPPHDEGGSDAKQRIVAKVREVTGLNLANYKDSTFGRRLQRRILKSRAQGMDDYETLLANTPREAERLRDEMLIPVTSFLRDPSAFADLAAAIEALVHTRPPEHEFRVWVPGCATGEEVYTIAILLAEALGEGWAQRRVRVFATDLSTAALGVGRRGVYTRQGVAPLGAERVARFFEPHESHADQLRVCRTIRDWVVFSIHDLTSDAPFARIDVSSCRNVLIYLRQDASRNVIDSLHFSLAPDGVLFVGQAESVSELLPRFEPRGPGQRVFKRLPGLHLPRLQPRTGAMAPRRVVSANDDDVGLLRALLQASAAVVVAVDRDGMILGVHGEAEGILGLPSGKPVLSIEKLVVRELRADVVRLRLRTDAYGAVARSRPRSIGGRDEFVRVSVVRWPAGAKSEIAHLFAFERWPADAALRKQLPDALRSVDDSASDIAEYVNLLTERHNAVSEEFQTLNEELQSANEELQSSNEELETANEELQAANEELVMVNDELTAKSRELGRAAALIDGMMDALPYGIVVVDRDQTVIVANAIADAIFLGVSTSVGKSLYVCPLVVPIPNLSAMLAEVAAVGRPCELQVTGLRSYAVRVQRVLDAARGLDGFSITFVDNTEHIASERARHDAETRFGDLIAHAPMALYVTDAKARIVHANQALSTTFGLHDTVIGKTLAELLPPRLAAELEPRDRAARLFDEPSTQEALLELDSRDRSFVFTRYPLHTRDGAPDGLCVVATDVTELRDGQRMQRMQAHALDRSAHAIVIVDVLAPDMPIVFANDTFLRMTGYGRDEVVGRNCRFLQNGDRDQPALAEMRLALHDGRAVRVRLRNYRKDGSLFWNDLALYPLPDERGFASHFVGIQDDVTRRVATEEAARLDQQVLRLAQSLAHVGTFELDLASGTVLSSEINDELFGLGPDKSHLDFETLRTRVHPEDVDRLDAAVEECLAGRSDFNLEYRVCLPAGTVRWLHSRGNVTRNSLGKAVKLLGLSHDVTERRQADEQLRYVAHHDALTGLPNRALLIDRLTRALSKARRQRKRAALMFLDLDQFKDVNDTLGHATGDALLQQVARRLHSLIRTEDTLSRQGGDEFLILLEDVGDETSVQAMANKLVVAAAQPYTIDDNELRVLTSIGIALYPEDGETPEDLIRNADAAMYHAKQQGRGRFEFFRGDMTQRAVDRLTTTNLLRAAIPRGELVLHYQPIYDLNSGTVHGYEGLLRWQRDGRLLSPGDFLGQVADCSVMIELGWWVIERAMADAKFWREAGVDVGHVAINVTPHQFREGKFLRFLLDTARSYGVDPSSVVLEITEQAMMGGDEQSLALLDALHRTGFKISIDDFGTGYSSLSYLKRLPVDFLKIDRDFVEGLPDNKDDIAIVEAVLSIARTMGMSVVAEGIEHQVQWDFLAQANCHFAQGFLMMKPISPSAVVAMARTARAARPGRPPRQARTARKAGEVTPS